MIFKNCKKETQQIQMSWWLRGLSESLCHLENRVMRKKCQLCAAGATAMEVGFLAPSEEFSLFCALLINCKRDKSWCFFKKNLARV